MIFLPFKVQTILDKMKEKEETPRRGRGPAKAKLEAVPSTPNVETTSTPTDTGRRRKRRGEDASPAIAAIAKEEETPKRTPKRARKVKGVILF